MKTIAAAVIILISPLSVACGQQQDSLILDSVHVELGTTNVGFRAWGVTFDSLEYYNIPLTWNAPMGGVHIQLPHFYFGQIYDPCWSHFDTINTPISYLRISGFRDPYDSIDICPSFFTNGVRNHFLTMRIVIDPDTPAQIVTFDTTRDDRSGSLSFGINPAFKRGYIIIGQPEGIGDSGQAPKAFTLSQNYPNPFNAQTTISYTLPQAGPVTLSIYNITGQKVATLVNGIEQAGEHKVVWDAGDVASGIYFYFIQTSKYFQTKKMILMR